MRYQRTSSRARRAVSRRAASRRGLTLIEMLVAIAATLVLMTAVTQVIDMLGGPMADNRATIEMMDRLRSVRQKLQGDLAGHTAQALPWQDAETGGGYLEIIEGNLPERQDRTDNWPQVKIAGGNFVSDTRFGDTDDVIALTVRSQGQPFVDTSETGNNEESYVAEVIWYLKENPGPNQQTRQDDDPPRLYTLYRHIELVRRKSSSGSGTTPEILLGELTKRENRAGPSKTGGKWSPRGGATSPGQLPYEFNINNLPDSNLPSSRKDVVLTNVLSFDVKVWDPEAPIYSSENERVMAPGDPGFRERESNTLLGVGAYVDLAYETTLDPASHFSSWPNDATATKGRWELATWDTWPRYYERDGVDTDKDPMSLVDQGNDGFDNDGQNGVDDPGELETRPPYDHPLRGIRVTIRIYEPGSQQVRQVSVVQHFMPE